MANQANAARLLSAKMLLHELHDLRMVAGMLIKMTRSYRSAQRPSGLTQQQVATAAGSTQNTITRLENGKYIPADPELSRILHESGFDLAQPGASALLTLLQAVRDNEVDIKAIPKEKPL